MTAEQTSARGAPLAAPQRGGVLEWGVKASFRRYVAAVPDGVCDVSPEIRLVGEGRFGFPLAHAEAGPPALLRFTGQVAFSAHGGLLYVAIEDPWLSRDAGDWLLTCMAPGSAAERIRIAVGRFDANSAHEAELRIPVRLTDTGAYLFGGNYQPGEALDDLMVRLPGDGLLAVPSPRP